MKKRRYSILKDTLVCVFIMAMCFALCLVLQNIFDKNSLIPSIFILGAFLTSVVTYGYVYGIVFSVISVLAVNFAFTFPYFKLNFTMPQNIVSTVIMIAITLITCGLTSKLKYQEAIKAESEMEKTRADLFRAVSHDLRTPLTTIYGSSTALLETENEFTEEQKIKMLKSIKQESLWLFRMVENLLSVTRLDNGNVKIIKTPTVLDELIDSVILKFHKRCPGQNVDIDIPDYFVSIPMDAILIEQVIMNILENAVQHAKGMDKLSLKVSVVQNKAVFEIADNGSGIPEEKLKTIFGGCYTGDDVSYDCKRSNAGIGLAVCSTIIKAHGGKISVKNRKSGGAVFKFSLDVGDVGDDLQ